VAGVRHCLSWSATRRPGWFCLICCKFVFDLPNISAGYKHLIMVAVAAAVNSHLCTETFIKVARRAGVSKEEIGEALLAARFALASTIFATAVEGMEYLAEQGT